MVFSGAPCYTKSGPIALPGQNIFMDAATNKFFSFLQQASDFFSSVPEKIWNGAFALSAYVSQLHLNPVGWLFGWLKSISNFFTNALAGTGSAAAGMASSAVNGLAIALAVIGALLILLAAGFILIKLLQFSSVRYFLTLGIIGAVIITMAFGVRYVIVSLFSNINTAEISEITKKNVFLPDTSAQEQSESIITTVKIKFNQFVEAALHPLSLFNSTQAVDGGWGAWQEITSCSRACGGGFKVRARECDSPAPANGGNFCNGPSRYLVNCNTGVCPAAAPQNCSSGCAQDCGPYRAVNQCFPNGICQQCADSCQSDSDCAAGLASCVAGADGRKICSYYSFLPLLSEFKVAAPGQNGQVVISWSVDPWTQNRLSNFELWRQAENSGWEIVDDYKNISSDKSEVIDTPTVAQKYRYGLHAVAKSQYSSLSFQWLTDRGYDMADMYKLVKSGYTLDDLDRIKREGLSEQDQLWLINNGYNLTAADILSANQSQYGTETMSGFQPVTVHTGISLNLDEYVNFTEGLYTAFEDAGIYVMKKDIVYGGLLGTFTRQGGRSPNSSIIFGFGLNKYYRADEDDERGIAVVTPYVSISTHPLWLMGKTGGVYGEFGGGQDSWQPVNSQNYFKHLIEVNNPGNPLNFSSNGYYERRENDKWLPYADAYFPAGEQNFSTGQNIDSAQWNHGGRPFLEWEGKTYYLGGNFEGINSGFTEAISWNADKYLNYVNNYYSYLEIKNRDFLGINGQRCSRSTKFLETLGAYQRTPLCPSPELLNALDATAGGYNVIRTIFYENVLGVAGRCPGQTMPMVHPYQENGQDLIFDEHTQERGGYAASDRICIYEAYYLQGHDLIIRNWHGEKFYGAVRLTFAVDIGQNGLFEFMVGQPVKGSKDAVYLLEKSGDALYKRWLTLEEYENRGGRYIPISDAVLNNIPEY